MSRYARTILDIVNASSEHLTAEQIYLRLKESMPGVVLATVYNNLRQLVGEGRIRRIALAGGADRYDKTARHDHLICRDCGKLMDFTFADLTGQLSEQLGEEIISYDLQVTCLCPACRQAQRESN